MIIKLKTNNGIIEKDSADILKAFRGSDQETKYTMGIYSFVKAITKLLESKWQARMFYGKNKNPWLPLFKEYDNE